MSATTIGIEVVYGLPERQVLRRVSLPEGSSVGDAIEASGLARDFPEIDPKLAGIFGKRVRTDAKLHDGERVELYRPLRADPKEVRRRRAAEKPGKR
jgi:uncharacterized protein